MCSRHSELRGGNNCGAEEVSCGKMPWLPCITRASTEMRAEMMCTYVTTTTGMNNKMETNNNIKDKNTIPPYLTSRH